MWRDTLASLFRVGLGFGIAVVLGVPLGLWMGHQPYARLALLPVVNFFRCLSREQLDHVIKLWLGHYHTARPHQGADRKNNVLAVDFTPQTVGEVCCREKLGGIVREYYREAA